MSLELDRQPNQGVLSAFGCQGIPLFSCSFISYNTDHNMLGALFVPGGKLDTISCLILKATQQGK